MCKILLSINPEHVESILNGEKLYEYRKVKCKTDVEKILIYSTSPVMKVVGEVDVVDIIINKPEIVWSKTSLHAGISKLFFDKYFCNRDKAVAYKLANIKKFEKPKDLAYYGINFAPQSFVYIR